MKASLLYRTAAILLVLFAIGHMVGFRQSDPQWGTDAMLASMRSIHFDMMGFNRSYWALFSGLGFCLGVFTSSRRSWRGLTPPAPSSPKAGWMLPMGGETYHP